MSIAITDDHRALADTAIDLLQQRGAREANRKLLEAEEETLPPFWDEIAKLGWLGLHVSETHGGSGFGIEELAVVMEQMGRTLAPGPFAPTVIASALLDAKADDATKQRWLPGLTDGALVAGVSFGDEELTLDGGALSGSAPVVLGAGLAQILLLPMGDDVVIAEVDQSVSIETPRNVDPSRRSARVTFDGTPSTVIVGGRRYLAAAARAVLSAEVAGLARESTELAAEYAKQRVQFGRPIGTFQGVKHHCANMAVATELTTGAAWDAARAAADGEEQFSYAAALAATLAAPTADFCANLNTQVHGGIAVTFEHDAHLFMRRATALLRMLSADTASAELTQATAAGTERSTNFELPPEAETIRTDVLAFIEEIAELPADEQQARMVESGYAVPHWPKPFGRDAGAVEQLVIEQELRAAKIRKPAYGITGWVILTLIQYGTADQVARWVKPALDQEVIWCQLFSEPEAGSDAAAVKTRATRVDGGWLLNGQKVWTSGAHVSGMGFATVRTNPDVPKHQGITTMVIDMKAEGVEVRPIKMPAGASEFNEVFFDDVFVPDDDVVGPVDEGWSVARATLGNESVSIGGGQGALVVGPELIMPGFEANPERLYGGEVRLGRYIARHQALGLLNMRSALRAVAGGEPGPEGAIAKLVLSEQAHEATAITTELAGPDSPYLSGAGDFSNTMMLFHRGLSIAGGSSEIKRNQIGERILGLPRDPLVK